MNRLPHATGLARVHIPGSNIRLSPARPRTALCPNCGMERDVRQMAVVRKPGFGALHYCRGCAP